MAKKKTKKAKTCPPASSAGCTMSWRVLLVIVAILYMATDLGWITWWKLSWWTTGFILLALYYLFSCRCD